MKKTFGFRLLATVATVLALGLFVRVAVACDMMCRSTYWVANEADSIVIGTTVKLKRREVDSFRQSLEYDFRIDEVLKGTRYRPGAVIQIEGRYWGSSCDEPPLPEPGGTALVYLVHSPDGKPALRSACGGFVPPTENLRHQIAVSLSPMDYLDSEDPGDVALILESIASHTVDPPLLNPMSLPKPSPRPLIDSETAIKFLVQIVERVDTDSFHSALPLLANLSPAKARQYVLDVFFSDQCDGTRSVVMPDAWTDLYRWSDPCEVALGQLITMGDSRAVPIILERLAKLHELDTDSFAEDQRRHHETRISGLIYQLAALGDGRAVPALDRELEGDAKIPAIHALAKIDDPRVVPLLINELDGEKSSIVVHALAGLDDPRVVPALLSRVWKSDRAAEKLEQISDFRIAPAVRPFRFDQKRAPAILAAQGETEDRAFMHRLILQGRPEGAMWAANAVDHSAEPLLLEALENCYWQASFEICYALGRLRTFDVILPLLEGRFQSFASPLGMYGRFLQGVLGDPFHARDPVPLADYLRDIELRIHDVAECEAWTDQQLDLVLLLLHEWRAATVEQQQDSDNFGYRWHPPDALPDMPDPFFQGELVAFLYDEAERCRAVLRNGSDLDKFRILATAKKVDVNLLDHDLVLKFLLSEHESLRQYAVWTATPVYVTFSVGDIKRWARDGNYAATHGALYYMANYPRPEFQPIIVEVFHRGWHLFDQALHDAIVANHVTDLDCPLYQFLQGQHVELRNLAAATRGRLRENSAVSLACPPSGA